MREIASLRVMGGVFAVLGWVANLVRWKNLGGQDKGERCAPPSTPGRFLVSQGVRKARREVQKNNARCSVASNPALRPISYTSRRKIL